MRSSTVQESFEIEPKLPADGWCVRNEGKRNEAHNLRNLGNESPINWYRKQQGRIGLRRMGKSRVLPPDTKMTSVI